MKVKKILLSQLKFKLDPILRAIESCGLKRKAKSHFHFNRSQIAE